MEQARKTHIYSYHAKHGNIVTFAGYFLPVWFKGIREEHIAVRDAAGLFDVSHMGRFDLAGPGACNFLDHILPTKMEKITDGRAFYSLILNEQGGIIDDTVISKRAKDRFLIVGRRWDVGLDRLLSFAMFNLSRVFNKKFATDIKVPEVNSSKG